MTKQFCDLCEQPAMTSPPSIKVQFSEKTWHGIKSTVGVPGGCDGTWVPFVEARIVFDLHNTSRSASGFHPDICQACAEKLIRKLADSLVPIPGI